MCQHHHPIMIILILNNWRNIDEKNAISVQVLNKLGNKTIWPESDFEGLTDIHWVLLLYSVKILHLLHP